MKQMLRLINNIFYIIPFFFLNSAFALETEWSNGIESQVRIISPYTQINDNEEIYLGLQYKLKDGWKTYWRSSGEGGFPQNVDWQSSTNIKNLEILWPTPQYFEILGFTSIGYIEEVIYPLKINIDNINKKTSIILDINYLTCKEICIPGSAQLALDIQPGKAQITEHYYTIQKKLSSIPRTDLKNAGIKSFSVEALKNDSNVSLIFSIESSKNIRNPNFFLHSDLGLPVVKPEISFSPNLKKINAKFDFNEKSISKDIFNLKTIFVNSDTSFEYNNNIIIKEYSKISILNNSIIHILLISLIGGLILNAMPCVLPVISIKVLSVLKFSKNKLEIRKSFLITSLGIISSFILLASSLIFIRLLGINIGWGMQFQQPVFLIIIAFILFIFTINLFGFFEFQSPRLLNSKIFNKINFKGYLKDFFNGFFATLMATPCSAPFVGTAITAAFTQSLYIMLGIFTFMGLGMALPYLFISLFPNLIIFFPKPGIWMQYVKYFLGILLFGTFIWVISILMNHFSFYENTNLDDNSNWIDFKKVDIENIRQNNDIVFVDITADWCATCQFNKINVINSKSVSKKFEELKVVKVRGDWTKPDRKIEKFLQENNKFGIPFNIIYNKSFPNGIILSELLSVKEIYNILEQVKTND